MFHYYLVLGMRSLRRNPVLTALMILTLAVGVAASVSTLTILHVMSGNPIPHKSDRLIVPLLDVAQLQGYVPGEKNPYGNQSSYTDVMNYLRSGQGVRRTALFEVTGSIEPARREDAEARELRTRREHLAVPANEAAAVERRKEARHRALVHPEGRRQLPDAEGRALLVERSEDREGAVCRLHVAYLATLAQRLQRCRAVSSLLSG